MNDSTIPQRDGRPGRMVRAIWRTAVGSFTAYLVIFGASVPVGADAASDTPGCVSVKELARVADKPWPMRRVHRVFDTRGYGNALHYASQVREYESCERPRSYPGAYFERDDEGTLRLANTWRSPPPQ